MADVFDSPLAEPQNGDRSPGGSVAGMAPTGEENALKKILDSTPYQVCSAALSVCLSLSLSALLVWLGLLPPADSRLARAWLDVAASLIGAHARVCARPRTQAFSVFIIVWSLVFDDLRVLAAPKSVDTTLVRRRVLASILRRCRARVRFSCGRSPCERGGESESGLVTPACVTYCAGLCDPHDHAGVLLRDRRQLCFRTGLRGLQKVRVQIHRCALLVAAGSVQCYAWQLTQAERRVAQSSSGWTSWARSPSCRTSLC